MSLDDYFKLKILIHVHDTFKPDAKTGAPITDPQSHSSLARAYLANFTDDSDLLAMVQWHDEPYALWRGFHSKGHVNPERFDALAHAINDWDLFLLFNIIDATTEGKGVELKPLRWFLKEIQGKVHTKISEADLIPSTFTTSSPSSPCDAASDTPSDSSHTPP